MKKKYNLYLYEDIEYIYYPEYLEDNIIAIFTLIEIETIKSDRKSVNFIKKYTKDYCLDIDGYISELTGKRELKSNSSYSENLSCFFVGMNSLYSYLVKNTKYFYINRNNILKKEIEQNNIIISSI